MTALDPAAVAAENPDLPGIYHGHCGIAAPGTDADNASRRTAGWPAHVFRLRYVGLFLSRNRVLGRPQGRQDGLLVCTKSREGDWLADLHPPSGELRNLLQTLRHVRLIKRRDDGCVLLAGLEWDEGCLRQWPQTWLCGPTLEAAGAALNSMDAWLTHQYEAARRTKQRAGG